MSAGPVRTVMRWIFSLFYLFAAYLHLSNPTMFMAVMPSWVPAPYRVIQFTGVCEVAGAIGLMIPLTRWWAGVMLALYAICVFPANIHHAMYGPAMPGLSNMWIYHGPRLLFQPVLVWWALYVGNVIDWPFRRRTGLRGLDAGRI